MDLSKLNTAKGSEQGYELQLTNPATGADLGVYITVLGRDSLEFKKLQGEHSRKRIAKMHKAGIARGVDVAEIEKETIEVLSACTKSWRTIETVDGKPVSNPILILGKERLEFSRDAAARVYTEYSWIKEQIDAAVADRANFLPR